MPKAAPGVRPEHIDGTTEGFGGVVERINALPGGEVSLNGAAAFVLAKLASKLTLSHLVRRLLVTPQSLRRAPQ
jgi:hypothetical protein